MQETPKEKFGIVEIILILVLIIVVVVSVLALLGPEVISQLFNNAVEFVRNLFGG